MAAVTDAPILGRGDDLARRCWERRTIFTLFHCRQKLHIERVFFFFISLVSFLSVFQKYAPPLRHNFRIVVANCALHLYCS